MKELETGVAVTELQAHPVLGHLPSELAQRVARRARRIALKRAEPLFQQGQPARFIYVCTEGHLKLYRIADDGAEKIVNLIGPGRSFAEATMFMVRRVYPVHCAALQPSTLIAYDADDLVTLFRGSPELCFSMLGILSRRLHQKIGQIEALSLQNATMRVASYLMQQLERAGGDRIELSVSKKYIANFLSVQPETFSRIITQLQEAGVVSTSGRSFHLLDRARLAAIAQGVEAQRAD